MRRLIIVLLVGAWCVVGHATGHRGNSFGVSVTVIRQVVTPTPGGAVSTICYEAPCIPPRVTVGPVDPETGIRVVEITY